jgi:hypothetical protein
VEVRYVPVAFLDRKALLQKKYGFALTSSQGGFFVFLFDSKKNSWKSNKGNIFFYKKIFIFFFEKMWNREKKKHTAE